MRLQRRGQSVLEYTILLVIVIAALVAMQAYLKRGVQGHWKESVDGLGEQYDQGRTNSIITHQMQSTSESRMQTVKTTNNSVEGYYTMRSDASSSQETRNGHITVAPN